MKCNVSFDSRESYVLHCEVEHLEKNWECPLCSQRFKRKRDWQRHKRETHGTNVKVFNCNKCEFTTKRKGNLNKHLNRKHEEKEKGNLCLPAADLVTDSDQSTLRAVQPIHLAKLDDKGDKYLIRKVSIILIVHWPYC